MIVKIFDDVFDINRIESICVSTELPCGIEINTHSGGTYEYDFKTKNQRNEILHRLHNILIEYHNGVCIDVTRASEEINDNIISFSKD